MIDGDHDLLCLEPQAHGDLLDHVDRRAVEAGLTRLLQTWITDRDAEAFEEALERGRPAVHGRRLDNLGRETAVSSSRS